MMPEPFDVPEDDEEDDEEDEDEDEDVLFVPDVGKAVLEFMVVIVFLLYTMMFTPLWLM